MPDIVQITDLRKSYKDGFQALKGVTLGIREGEILALLGPNGAGKTTLISTICGITTATSGSVKVGGHDIVDDFRAARAMIGLVPQEINLEPFERVINTVRFSRGLFGKGRDDGTVEKVLRQLSLWDKKDNQIRELSGGMKRRVLIAKALAHDPRVLFLDEPTAGVDVELRKDMWEVVAQLKADGVTIILTTHYIEEAEAIADRVGVIAKGELMLVEEKDKLMRRMGQKELEVQLTEKITEIPARLRSEDLRLSADGGALIYTYDTQADRTGITKLLADVSEAGLVLRDVATRQSSLEEIFVGLVSDREDAA
jgi:ABC-2 type transport system ATP-binding protein